MFAAWTRMEAGYRLTLLPADNVPGATQSASYPDGVALHAGTAISSAAKMSAAIVENTRGANACKPMYPYAEEAMLHLYTWPAKWPASWMKWQGAWV